MSILEVNEGVQYQSADEELAFKITTTNWQGTPTSPTFNVFDESVDLDVGTTVCPGTASSSGNDITLPLLKDLTVDHSYRVEVEFTVGSNIWECYFIVRCVR